MNNQFDQIIVIESRGAHTECANYYKNEDTWLDAIAAYALQNRSDVSIQTQSDAVSYLQDKDNVSVQIITKAEFLDVEGWDDEIVSAAKAAGWVE